MATRGLDSQIGGGGGGVDSGEPLQPPFKLRNPKCV